MKAVKDFIKARIKDAVFWGVFPFVYKRAVKHSDVVPGSALFLGRNAAEMPDSFALLFKRFEQAGGPAPQFLSLGYGRLKLVPYYLNCVSVTRELAKYRYIFLDDANDVVSCLPLRGETDVVQLWHACGAFKKWGMSTGDLLFGGSRQEKRRHPYYENLSLVTISAPGIKWAYAEAMDLEGRDEIIKPLGVSRTDVFFDDAFIANARQAVERVVPQITGKNVVLYAPTFRGSATHAQAPDALDISLMREKLGDRYVLLIKHHPFVKDRPQIPAGCEEFAFDVSDDLPIDQLLCVTDVCVSDYSSLVFEYSLFERPMAFFAYDKADYDDWRGFYYDYDELTPGPVVETTEELIAYIKQVDDGFDPSEVRAFRDRFMSACDGHATDRIYTAVVGESAS